MIYWCKGILFYEKLAQYHLRYAEYLSKKYGFNFTYDTKLLGLYKDKKQISNMSYYKGDFNREFYDCLLKKYGISQVQIEDLMHELDTSDFSKDIKSSILDIFNYTNYELHQLQLAYHESSRLNDKYRTFKNHIKDKVIINEVVFESFHFPRPRVHIKVKTFNIRCNLTGLGYENFVHYYQDFNLKPQELKLDTVRIHVPVTDHVINKNGKLISFDQRVIINLNEYQN